MFKILLLATKDFFDRQIIFWSLIPVIISMSLLGVLFFSLADKITAFFVWLITLIPYISGDLITNVLQDVASIFIFYQLTLILSVLLVGLVADKIVARVNAKYYQLEPHGFGTFLNSIIPTVKANLLFSLLFIFLLPLMFVPLLNVIVQVWLWAILIKSPMLYDALAYCATKEQFYQIQHTYRTKIWLLSIGAASLFLIPVFGLFLYIFQLLLFIHFGLNKLKMITTEK